MSKGSYLVQQIENSKRRRVEAILQYGKNKELFDWNNLSALIYYLYETMTLMDPLKRWSKLEDFRINFLNPEREEFSQLKSFLKKHRLLPCLTLLCGGNVYKANSPDLEGQQEGFATTFPNMISALTKLQWVAHNVLILEETRLSLISLEETVKDVDVFFEENIWLIPVSITVKFGPSQPKPQ